MSVSYGRVKLGVPAGFKEMLEIVTREILREQPRNIPGFLEAYFKVLNENQQKGCTLGSLVTERIIEVVEKPENVDAGVQGEIATQEACTQDDIQKEAAVTEVQTENIKTCTSDAQVTAKPEQEVAEQQTTEVQTAEVEASTDEVQNNQEEAAEKTNHISVSSLSQMPADFRMVNCEVICQQSVEALATENNNEQNEAQDSENQEATNEDNENQEANDQESESQNIEAQDSENQEAANEEAENQETENNEAENQEANNQESESQISETGEETEVQEAANEEAENQETENNE